MMRIRKFSRSTWATLAVGGVLVGVLAAGLGAAPEDAHSAGFAGPPSFADVLEQVSPAVVTIAVMMEPVQTSAQGAPYGNSPFDDFLQRFGLQGGPQWNVPDMQPRMGEGSGFIIDSDGYIATNNHVVDGATQVKVTLKSGEELQAKVVGTDPSTDLALLKVDDGKRLPSLEWGDSDKARVGDWVLAIGNPFGLGGSATAGIISARGRDIQSGRYDDFIQVDAAINSGNSGGPIFNSAGQVIGINTAIISPNGGNVGIGMAIPSNQAKSVLAELRDHGTINRGWLGLEIGPAENDQSGAEVASVVVNSPADEAGLTDGDIVTKLNDKTIDSPKTLSRLVGNLEPGDKVRIEYLRDGKQLETSTVLGALDNGDQRAAVQPVEPDQRSYRFYRYETPETPFRR
jgi:serine protease Do